MHRLAVAALVLAACSSPGATQGQDALCAAPSWKPVFDRLDRSALCLWGSAMDDLYVVGGGLGKGGALVLHWDGDGWHELATGRAESLWWIWGTGDGQTVWMVGEQGVVLRADGGRVQALASGTTAPLYGVWGAAADDVWIVGGTPGGDPGDDDVVLHWDGRALARVTLPQPRGTALFKVWGATKDDLWVTGEAGTIWHRRGDVWVDESSQVRTVATLSAVHGCSANEVWTVGGQDVFRRDAGGWQRVAAPVPSFAAGVACGADSVLIVGSGGMKLRLDKATGTWFDETRQEPWNTDFHGAFVAPDGTLWAAGGNYVAPASKIDSRVGVVAYRGCGIPR